MFLCCSELEEALLVLPLSYVTTLLSVLNECVERGWETELCSRALLYLLRSDAAPLLISIQSSARAASFAYSHPHTQPH